MRQLLAVGVAGLALPLVQPALPRLQATNSTGHLRFLSAFNSGFSWDTAYGHPSPVFSNVHYSCNLTMLLEAAKSTGTPGFIAFENCPSLKNSTEGSQPIWRYPQHPQNITNSLAPGWERTVSGTLEQAKPAFHDGSLVGVFLGE